MSNPVTLCNAVFDIINAGSYTLSPTVSRTYVPYFQNEDISATVAVYLGGLTHEKQNRCGYFTTDVEVRLAVMLPISVDDQSEIEGGINLLEELKSVVWDPANLLVGDFALVEITNDQIFDFQVLHEHSVFQSILVLTYRG